MAATPRSVWRNPLHFVAFGFGAGAIPWIPGTWGTLVAVIVYPGLQWLPLTAYLLLVVVAAVIGIGLCGRTARQIGVHDHSGIVWDEFVGYWVTMTAAPDGWPWIVAGFVLFRLFDVSKPWPIGWLDRQVEGGLGIMADDVVAGIMACLCLQLAAMVLV